MYQYLNLFIKSMVRATKRMSAHWLNLVTSLFIISTFVNVVTCLTTGVDEEALKKLKEANDKLVSSNDTTTTSAHSLFSTETAITTSTTKMPSFVTNLSQPSTNISFKPVEPERLNATDAKLENDATSISPELVDGQLLSNDGRLTTRATGNELEDRIGITAAPEDGSKLITSTSSYFVDTDQDDEYGLRNILTNDSIDPRTTYENATQAPIAIPITELNHLDDSKPIIGIANKTNDLQSLESRVVTANDGVRIAKQQQQQQDSQKIIARNSSLAIINATMERPNTMNWSSPLGNRFFVPQLGSSSDLPLPPSTTTESPPPSMSDDERDKQLIQDTIISQANIVDLLHIIKHLNLINGSSSNGVNAKWMPDTTTNLNEPKEAVHQSAALQTLGLADIEPIVQIISRSSALDHHQPNGIQRSLNTNFDTGKTHRNTQRPDVVMSMLASPSSPGGTVERNQRNPEQRRLVTVGNNPARSGEDSKFLSKFAHSMMDSTLSAKRSSRLWLNSPYSANFDTGLQMLKNVPTNRASVDSYKDHVHGSKANTESTSQTKQAIRSTQIKIGSKPAQMNGKNSTTKTKTKQHNNDSNKVQVSTSTNSHHGDQQQQKDNKVMTSNENESLREGEKRTKSSSSSSTTKTTRDSSTQNATKDQADSSKRNERDASNSKLNQIKQQPPYQHQIKVDDERSNVMNQHQRYSQQVDASTDKPPPSPTTESDGPTMKTANHVNDQSIDSSSHFTNNIINGQKVANGFMTTFPKFINHHLDDPHKKSYYWSPEHSDLYMDDLGLPADHFPKPLTIGELARHHGVNPFFPLTKHSILMNDLTRSFNLPTYQPSEDFGLSSESGLQEDYAQLPANNLNHGGGGGGSSVFEAGMPGHSKSRLNLDDELKQKIAVKAFEAAMRDPELSTTLFGNLFNNMNSAVVGVNGNTSTTMMNHHQHVAIDSNQILDHLRPLPVRPLANTMPTKSIANPMHFGAHTNFDALTANYNPLMADNRLPPMKPNDPFNLMMPMATVMHDQVADIGGGATALTNNLGPAPINTGPGVGGHSPPPPPVNLVITDLANKWALSRMPDLVPIPLAATVPGYLIRLPNGKIFAAALTNMFSIQGIQREPLNGSYKSLLNHKFKVSNKQLQPKLVHLKQKNTFANLASDSGSRPTFVMPSAVHNNNRQNRNNAHKTTTTSSRLKNQSNKNHGDRGASLFSRGVINQLSTFGGKTNNVHKISPSRQTITQPNIKQTTVNKSKVIELLQNLPIADPSEPVFSFSDESELNDEPTTNYNLPPAHHITSSHLNRMYSMRHPMNQLGNEQSVHHDHATSSSDTVESAGKLAEIKSKLNHLLSLKHYSILAGDELFKHGKRKRKSSSRFTFAKLEPIMNWLTTRRKILTRRDPRLCNDNKE
jgi:hypothetical protein